MQRKHPTESNTGRTDSTRIQKPTNTIHHEITQLTSIREYGFHTNPNDVTREKVMDSLHRPQSESVDSTRILEYTKPKQRSKRNHNNRYKNTQPNTKSGVRERHASQCNKTCKSGLTDIQTDHPSPQLTLCQENPRKQGGTQNEVKISNFEKTFEIKTHLTFGPKNPKNPKIIEIGHRMQKRPA